jgi:uncharacterized membrane protein YdjX (TVP38/TMEM64 family)
MRLLLTTFALAAIICVPFAIWGGEFTAWFTGDAAIAWVRARGPWGGLAVIALLMSDLILPIPSTAVMSAAGYLYGTVVGGLLSAAGSFAAGLTGYWLCRSFGPRAAARLVGKRELDGHATLFHRNGPWLVAFSRWMPVLPELISCLAGLTRMPARVFTIALACGSLPLGFIYAAIGTTGHTNPAVAIALSLLIPPALWLLVRPLMKTSEKA